MRAPWEIGGRGYLFLTIREADEGLCQRGEGQSVQRTRSLETKANGRRPGQVLGVVRREDCHGRQHRNKEVEEEEGTHSR